LKKTISGIRGIFGKDLNLKDIIEFSNNFSSLIKSQKCVDWERYKTFRKNDSRNN